MAAGETERNVRSSILFAPPSPHSSANGSRLDAVSGLCADQMEVTGRIRRQALCVESAVL